MPVSPEHKICSIREVLVEKKLFKDCYKGNVHNFTLYMEYTKAVTGGVVRTLKRGKLLDQAVILFNCVPVRNGNFS